MSYPVSVCQTTSTLSVGLWVAVLLVGLTLYHGLNATVATIMLFLDAWPDIPDMYLLQAEESSTGPILEHFSTWCRRKVSFSVTLNGDW